MANQVGFTGRWLDSTGMWYFRARYLEPVLGRFVSRDPKEYIDGANLYCGYMVPNYVDPRGCDEIDLKVASGALITFGVDIRNPSSLSDLLNKIKAKLRPCDCLRNLTLMGHGDYKVDQERSVQLHESSSTGTKGGPPAIGPENKGMNASSNLLGIYQLDPKTGLYQFKLDPPTLAFFTALKPLLCKDSKIRLYACNAGQGLKGMSFVNQIADASGSYVEGAMDQVSMLGFSLTTGFYFANPGEPVPGGGAPDLHSAPEDPTHEQEESGE